MTIGHRLKSLTELEEQIQLRIEEFDTKRAQNQKDNRLFTLTHLSLSTLTTLLIAINAKLSLFPLAIIAMTANSVAILASQLLTKFMYQERMAMNIATTCALRELSHSIIMAKKKEEDSALTHEITISHVDSYQKRYQIILNSADGQWQKNINRKKSQ